MQFESHRNKFPELIDRIKYIDMHIHMEDIRESEIRDDVLYLANSVDEISYEKTVDLAQRYPNVIPSFGIHPFKAFTTTIRDERLEELISRNYFAGEIGLDFHWIEDSATYDGQREIFTRQLALIKKYKAIPSIHTKGAEEEVLKFLRKYDISRSIIHWYSGPEYLIAQFLASGCYFTIGPDIFTGSQVYTQIPINRMFIETDNPTGMPWVLGGDYSGDDIVKIYSKLAEKMSIEEKKLIDQVKSNMFELIS